MTWYHLYWRAKLVGCSQYKVSWRKKTQLNNLNSSTSRQSKNRELIGNRNYESLFAVWGELTPYGEITAFLGGHVKQIDRCFWHIRLVPNALLFAHLGFFGSYFRALDVVTAVQRQLLNKAQRYRNFLEIFHRYQQGQLEVNKVQEQMFIVLTGPPDLLQAFTHFLPLHVQAVA